MNVDLSIEISQIISLANGDPESILPNLFSPRPSTTPQGSIKQKIPDDPSKQAQSSIKQGIPDAAKPLLMPKKEYKVAPFDVQEPLRKKLKLNNFMPATKNRSKYSGMKANEMRFRTQGDKVIDFCQEHGLIAKEVTCRCGKLMKLTRNAAITDGFIWMCRHRKTEGRPKQTIRKGTWFEKSKLSIADILWIAYMWVYEYSYNSMVHEVDQSPVTLVEWCTHCIDVCQAALECKSDPLGGEEISVEMYEGKFKKGTHKKSNNSDDKWIFCALEQYGAKSLFLIVEDKTSESLLQIFDKLFLPGTTVVSHIWCALKNMSIEDFTYLTTEKSITFYDQGTKSNMENFEDFKKVTSRAPPGANKWNKLEYGPALFEKMYRKSLAFAPDAYLAYLKDVSVIYKPCDKYVVGNSSKETND